MIKNTIASALLLGLSLAGLSQALDFTAVQACVDFSRTLQEWDGFGFNYVETAHSSDMDQFAQEYGGFSLLDEREKQEIIAMVFGDDGLRVGLVKMFLGSLHQQEAGGPYDHRHTTANMRYFVREGLRLTRSAGRDLEIITTLYGPPGYTTKQKVHRGRDLDPAYREAVADYMVDWVKFLVEKEQFPVKYLSLHNEGEDWRRWNQEGYTDWEGHDYNMYWPPEQVLDFVRLMPEKLKSAGLEQVIITNGTGNPDAFLVTNINKQSQRIAIRIEGSKAKAFEAFRTTKSPGSDLDEIDEAYISLGGYPVRDGRIVIDAPAGSVTTFYAK